MIGIHDFPTSAKALAVTNGMIVIQPRGTNYEIHLKPSKPFNGPPNSSVEGLIRAQARKVLTVPSGGNFVSPIFGPPRIIQGRVRHLEENDIVLQAGGLFIVEMPAADSAIDLSNGLIAVGAIVNVTVLPSASFEITLLRDTFHIDDAATTGAGAGH